MKSGVGTAENAATTLFYVPKSPKRRCMLCPTKGGGDMRSIIEALYYGNIVPTDRDVVKGGEYAHLLHLLSRNSTELEDTLSQWLFLGVVGGKKGTEQTCCSAPVPV